MLLSKKGKNSIYVWPGCDYCLQEVKTDRTQLCIEELAYICIKSGNGYFIRCSQLQENEIEKLEKSTNSKELNITNIANYLGVSRQTIYNLKKKHSYFLNIP